MMVEKEPAVTKDPTVTYIPLDRIRPFPGHPFAVRDDEEMREIIESVRNYGVVTPVLVRPIGEELYQLISGHRRKFACEALGVEDIPALIREMSDEEATIIMVDSNLQREQILPCERGAAYKMKLEAIKRQGRKTDRSEEAAQVIGAEEQISGRQIQRYIRLTELIPELQDMVDLGLISLTPAVELSYLTPAEQGCVVDAIDSEQSYPSVSQAQRMKKLSQAGALHEDTALEIMMEQKKTPRDEAIYYQVRGLLPAKLSRPQREAAVLYIVKDWLLSRQAGKGAE